MPFYKKRSVVALRVCYAISEQSHPIHTWKIFVWKILSIFQFFLAMGYFVNKKGGKIYISRDCCTFFYRFMHTHKIHDHYANWEVMGFVIKFISLCLHNVHVEQYVEKVNKVKFRHQWKICYHTQKKCIAATTTTPTMKINKKLIKFWMTSKADIYIKKW